MCRSIKTLFNFEPPATDIEVRAASLQFVRKLSGFTAPSKANEDVFNRAVDETFRVARRLVDSLTTTAHPRDRGEEAAKARARSAERFGRAQLISSQSSTRARARA
jgi:hypothetical protein